MMKWTERVVGILKATGKQVANAVVSILSTAGAVGSVAGGAGFAVARAANASFTTSYSGTVAALGGVQLAARIAETDIAGSGTIPLFASDKKEGTDTYKLSDYVDPNTLLIASTALIFAGLILRVLSGNLKKLQRQREDKQHFKSLNQGAPADPEWKEHVYDHAKYICGALFMIMMGHTLFAILFYPQGTRSISYPLSGDERANSTIYDGPVRSASVPVNVTLPPATLEVKLPLDEILKVLLSTSIIGDANVTYGGKLSLSSPDSTVSPLFLVLASLIAGFACYGAGQFFRESSRHERDKRIQQLVGHEIYGAINDPKPFEYRA